MYKVETNIWTDADSSVVYLISDLIAALNLNRKYYITPPGTTFPVSIGSEYGLSTGV